MAKLSNTPKQALNFDLERRKSYAFQVQVRTEDGNPIDLTGCTLRFVMKEGSFDDDPFDLLNVIVNSEALISDPTAGTASFAFQAAELDAPANEYDYSIVLWTPDGYSTLMCKGLVNILENSESHSMHQLYDLTSTASALELVMRSGDVIQINVAGVPVIFPAPEPGQGSVEVVNIPRRTPTGSADTQGQLGDILSDDNYLYVKTSTGWKRAALAAW